MRTKNIYTKKIENIKRGEIGMRDIKVKGNGGAVRNSRAGLVLVCLALLVVIGLPLSGGLSKAEAAVALRAAGSTAAVASGNLTLTIPAATQENDVMIMMISAKDNIVVSLPAGWTKFNELNNGTGLRSTMAWKRAVAGEGGSTVLVTHAAGNVAFGVIVSFSGAATSGSPIGASLATANASSNTVTANAITPTVANSMIIFTAFYGDDSATTGAGFGNVSGTNPTFTEAVDDETTSGTDTSMAFAYGIKTDTTTTGNRTCTAAPAATAVNIGALTALLPETKTNAGTASATAASSTSISVSMPYTDDVDNDNSCSTRYKLSSSGTWSSPAAGCADSGTALTKTISGLTDAEYYDVEMTYVDPDGINGTAVQTAYNVLLGPSNKTTSSQVTIRVMLNKTTNLGEVLLRMPFANDANGNNTYTVEYKLSSSGTWTTWLGGPQPHVTSGLYKTTITGLTPEERYDIRATFNDAADGVAGFGATQTYTNVLMNPTIHNSYNYSMRKWAGKWGVSGGKYGEFVCTTCHEKGATNIKRIKSSAPIIAPNSPTDQLPGEVGGSIVSFLNATDTTSDFGDDTSAHPTSQKICEVCHSVPEYHKYNQTVAAGHFNARDCMQCHNHATGFYPAGGQCKNCHNQAQNQMYNPRQIVDTTPATGAGDFVKLSRHVSNGLGGAGNEIVTNYDCAVCHREADANIIVAGEGWLDLYNHKNGSTQTSRYVMLRNVDDINSGWKWNKYSVTDQMRSDMDSFCLACHDSNGASAINVNAAGNGLNLSNTRALTPFNPNDNLRNGRDLMTTRTRVVDVKSQFYQGSGGSGSGYNGNPSQHAVLGARYSTTNASWTAATWTTHVTRKGQTMNVARETATLHCSDCHLVESNAHGAANAWHMLQNSTPGDFTTDSTPTVDANVVCYKCHSSTYYTNTAQTTGTRFNHANDSNPWGDAYGANAKLGPLCLLCHGGDGFGRIHGRGSVTDSDGDGTFAGSTYSPNNDPGNGTYTKQRFIPGAWMQWKPGEAGTEADWNTYNSSPSNAGCYFNTAAGTTWSGCSQHGASAKTGYGTNYARPTKY